MLLHLRVLDRDVEVPNDGPWHAVFIQTRVEGPQTTYEVIDRTPYRIGPEITAAFTDEADAETALLHLIGAD